MNDLCLKKGDRVTMLFFYAGLVSEETCEVVRARRNGNVILDNGYEFTSTGFCINDNTFGGARRKLKIESAND